MVIWMVRPLFLSGLGGGTVNSLGDFASVAIDDFLGCQARLRANLMLPSVLSIRTSSVLLLERRTLKWHLSGNHL
jgi:hypothetical protein